jgi:hypothetical protein
MAETNAPVTEIFVFGSNEAGRHGRGAALEAKQRYGARYGAGAGRTGDAYAIPTKDRCLRPLPLATIQQHVARFLAYATDNPRVTFKVTAIGTGLAGYRHEDIAPMFATAPANCRLPDEWRRLLRRGHFEAGINGQRSDSTHADLTGTLTRAAGGAPYRVLLRLSFRGCPHPETDETVPTRVLSGRLWPVGCSPRSIAGATMEEEEPCALGTNRIELIENVAEAAAIACRDLPDLRGQATFYGLAHIDGVVERVAAWEVGRVEGLPARLIGHTRPFTLDPGLDLEDGMEQARRAMCAECAAAPQAPLPTMQTRRPRAGQGTV